MRWTVIYRPDAADDLAAVWLNATHRKAITDAANAIDKQLSIDPLRVGESRQGNSRVLVEDPLAVYYDIDEQDRTVIVWGVVHRE